MLKIDFNKNTEKKFIEMQEIFNKLGEGALSSNHYQLVKVQGGQCTFTASDWKEFITDSRVADQIDQELEVIREYKIKELIADLNSDERSVGKAQILNALNNMGNNRANKTGPAFVYCYIPLNENEMKAPNVQILKEDPFGTIL